MSDKYYLLSYYVKVCQTCLSAMSIIVIFCQTCLTRVVAQDVEIAVGGSGESLIVEDITSSEPSDAGSSLDTVSDMSGQPELPSAINSDSDIVQDQSEITISPDVESGSTTDIASDSSGSMAGSGSSDSTGELLTLDSPQPIIGPGVVEQNQPEIAYSSVESEPQADVSPSLLMTSFALANPSPQLSITEVRIDGNDEYIELTNRGGPFIGSVSISGVKTSGLLNIALDLGMNESVVVGDTLAMVLASGFDIISNQGLSMTDTATRSLQLIYSGDVIDTLDLSATQVGGSDNQSAAREYDSVQQIWQVTPLLHNANTVSGHIGNPGLVWGLSLFAPSTGSSTTGSVSTGDISTGSLGTGATGTDIIATGTVSTGTVSTGTNLTGSIQIGQVYPFADCVGEHLALSFSAPYSGSLTIAGLGTSDTSKTFTISAQSGSLRYLVESMSGVLSDNVILVPNMTLTDGGESLIMTNGSGLVLDSIIYSSTQTNKISTFTSYSGDTRLFTTNQSPSILSSCSQSIQLPQIGGCRISAVDQGYITGSFSAGFTVSGSLVDSSCGSSSRLVDGAISTSDSCSLGQSFAPGSHRIIYQQYSGSSLICEDEYMFYGAIHQQIVINTVTTTTIQTGKQHSCGIVAQNSTPFRFGNSINLIASLDGDEIQNSSSYQCQRSGLAFTGSDSCNPGYFTLPQAILAPLQLMISKDGQQLCQTYSFINYPSISSSSSPSTSSSTYYEDLYRKWKSKHDTLATNIRQQGCTVNTQDQIGGGCLLDPTIQQQSSSEIIESNNQETPSLYRFQQHHDVLIDRIIVDPPGRDTDGGELVSIVWDDAKLQSGTSLALVINNKANRIVVGSGGSGLIQLIYDSFPLPNDGGCVALINLQTVYDQVCYGDYSNDDIVDLTTIKITDKMHDSFVDGEMSMTVSDNDDELELLNLDLREQKLINKVLKQEQYKEISDIRDRYRDKTDELYHTYRSITDSKQDYIDFLRSKLEQSRAYTNRITQLYQSNKEYIKILSDRNTQQYQEKLYIQQHYPAIYLDPALSQATGINMGSGLHISQLSGNNSQHYSLRSTLLQVLQNLFR